MPIEIMSKPSGILNIGSFLFGVLILVTLITSKTSFGYGIGDLFFIIILGVCLIGQVTFYVLLIRKRENYISLIYGSVFIMIYACFVYSLTYGRGTEQKWNGKIFIELQKETKYSPQNSPLPISHLQDCPHSYSHLDT